MLKQSKFGRRSARVWFVVFLAMACCGCLHRNHHDPAAQVVLLHGLGRSGKAMFVLQKRIRDAGFETRIIEYASLDEPPDVILESVAEQIAHCCADNDRPVHFVGHSLGGLILRAYLDQRPLNNLGRVVLLGSPNQGSELVDIYGDHWFFSILGPTARMLGTAADSFPNRIGPPYYPLGIIAGTSSFNPLTEDQLPGADDGLVSVKSTKLDGMTDFLLVDTGHSMLRYNQTVVRETIHFLKNGRFSGSPTDLKP